MTRTIAVGLFLTLAASLAWGQVFPDREYLDVVTISDGSVLVGRITENVPERYVEIEVYGGSVFVVAHENITSIEERPNPDYGERWIRIELGTLSAPEGETGDEANTPADTAGDGSLGGRKWLFPAGLGGAYADERPMFFMDGGAMRRIGSSWYGGLNVHLFMADIGMGLPISPMPFVTAAYGPDPDTFLLIADVMVMPPISSWGNPVFYIADVGAAFRRISAGLFIMGWAEKPVAGFGISAGYVF
jgi:hypothetical protein